MSKSPAYDRGVEKILHGALVELRPATADDVPELTHIRATPEVFERWGGGPDFAATVAEELADDEVHVLVIVHDGRLVGFIQWTEETEPDYRHASIDIYLD